MILDDDVILLWC